MKIRTIPKIALIMAGLTAVYIFTCVSAYLVLYWYPQWREKHIAPPQIYKVVSKARGLDELWSRHDIFASYNFGDPLMVSSKNVVVIMGSINRSSYQRILTLSGESGELLWSNFAGGSPRIAADSSGIYAGTGFGSVIKFEPRTGKAIWATWLSNISNIYRINVGENRLIVTQGVSVSILDTLTGEIVDFPVSPAWGNVYQISDDIVYVGGLKAIEISDGKTLWQNGFEGGIDESPLFGANQIYVRTGRFSGYVYSMDKSTGAVLWRTDQKVVSNIAVAGEIVFALTGQGELLCYEGDTGESHLLARFDPSPNDLAKSRPTVEGGYYVAADLNDRRVYVLFGDALQLYAFQMAGDICR